MMQLSANSAGYQSASQYELINAGPASKLAFTTPPQTVEAGTCSGPAVVAVQDRFGNAASTPGLVSVAVSPGSPTALAYADRACVQPLSGGQPWVPFYFADSAAGAWTLTASAADGGLAP